jgi:prophage regulatory protein
MFIHESAVMQSPSDGRRRPKHRQTVAAAQIPEARLKIGIVGELLGVSEATVRRRAAAGDLPAPIKDGTRCTRWVAADVMEYLRKRGAA